METVPRPREPTAPMGKGLLRSKCPERPPRPPMAPHTLSFNLWIFRSFSLFPPGWGQGHLRTPHFFLRKRGPQPQESLFFLPSELHSWKG